MKGTIKRRIRKVLTQGALRGVAGPVHDGLTRAELLAARLVDTRHAVPPLSPERLGAVTALIKTFERPRALRRLLMSLARWFPGIEIIVADDSRIPTQIPGINVIALPFDSGVSHGRQAGLARVSTEYTWVLDDDFVLYHRSCLGRVLDVLERHPTIDLVGGPVINLPLLRKSRSMPTGIYATAAAPRIAPGPYADGLEICDKVPNFYVARTERLKLVGWTPEIKRLDHADFFTRARGVLTTAYLDSFRCLHAQTPFDLRYMQHRLDCDEDRRIIRRRYGAPRLPSSSA